MSALQLRCPKSKAFLQRVLAACERIAPLKLADSSWDNVGLIAESPLPLRNSLVLVTNDLSLAVVQEAVQKQASVIISYHPPWFKAAKTINCTGALANLSYCIAHGISVYSPHTALDAIKGGSKSFTKRRIYALRFLLILKSMIGCLKLLMVMLILTPSLRFNQPSLIQNLVLVMDDW